MVSPPKGLQIVTFEVTLCRPLTELFIFKSHQQHASRYPIDQRPVRGYYFFRLLIFDTVMSYGTKIQFQHTLFSCPQRWRSSARLIWLLITLLFRFRLSFLKPLSNKPVRDFPIFSGEQGRQKARFCCEWCEVVRFPVLDKGVMHQKIQELAGVFCCNVLV